MTRKIADLAIVSGTTTDRDGNKKPKWETIGALWEADCQRMFVTIRRTFAPSGVAFDADGTNRDNIIINVFKSDKTRNH